MRGRFIPEFRKGIAMMKRVYLIGCPLGHSVSPAMHNAAFHALGMDWQYELLETPHENLPQAIARLRESDCAGANVTVPHKQAVMELLDEICDNARRIGAVNTIINRSGKLIGDNTDGVGFIGSLLEGHIHPRNSSAVILGAGGGACAVANALASEGAREIVINNRNGARAAELADRLHAQFPDLRLAINWIQAVSQTNILINATSMGMSPSIADSPMPRDQQFSPRTIVVDLVYKPLETKFLSDAKRAGSRTINGLGMLVHQGAAAFKLWANRDAPIAIMRDAAYAALKTKRE